MKEKSNFFKFLYVIIFVFPFLVGGYYVFTCCVVSIALAIGLALHIFTNKEINISKSYSSLVFLLITVLYLISRFWAVDSSMATEGFLKYLCLFLFIVSLWQIDGEERSSLFSAIPLSAGVMTISSVLLGLIPSFKARFYDTMGDLNGYFEYANAYALFLLVSIIILVYSHKNVILSVLIGVICAYGIYASNSRAIWLLSAFIICLIALVFANSKLSSKKKKFIFYASILIIISVFIVVLYISGYLSKILNYINTDGSLNERYLYYKDTLIYSLHHPFGRGAYAFYYAQPEFQSAYYYAIDVHCDYLQLMIEIGIIPSILFVSVLVLQLFKKNTSLISKLVLITIALHCAVDYDLQFISLFFILVLCIDFGNIKSVSVKSKPITLVTAVLIIGINVIIGLSNFYNYSGNHIKSVYFYKNTPSMLMILQSTNEQQAGYDLANEILKINDSVFEANNVLSVIYAENDRYEDALEQMELVIKKNPRSMQSYRDYIDLCVKAEGYYKKEGESEKAQHCIDCILSVPDRVKALKENTDQRGIKYGRKQSFNIGKEYKKIIKSYK